MFSLTQAFVFVMCALAIGASAAALWQDWRAEQVRFRDWDEDERG